MIFALFYVLYSSGKYLYRNYYARLQKQVTTTTTLCNAAQESKFHEEDIVAPKAEMKFHLSSSEYNYGAVLNVLNGSKYRNKIKKIADLGCGELEFLHNMKHLPIVEQIICVDINKMLLEKNSIKAEPQKGDHFCPRKIPLTIEICWGNATENDTRLENTDAVVCIELIEHLYPDKLIDLPYNIFGYIMPKVAIITTSNADFNVLFPNISDYRHPDYKFVWSRKQFKDWAQNIVTRYPSYSVTFQEICDESKDTGAFGLSQMAVFHLESEKKGIQQQGKYNAFCTVQKYVYPLANDWCIDERKIADKALYYIYNIVCRKNNDEYPREISLDEILSYLQEKFPTITMETLRLFLALCNVPIEDQPFKSVISFHPKPKSYNNSDTLECEQKAIDFSNVTPKHESRSYSCVNEELRIDEKISVQEILHANHWNEECSIVIPENRSVLLENTSYLLDKEVSSMDEFNASELPTHSSDINYLTSQNHLLQQWCSQQKHYLQQDDSQASKINSLQNASNSHLNRSNDMERVNVFSLEKQVCNDTSMTDEMLLNTYSSGFPNEPKFTSSPIKISNDQRYRKKKDVSMDNNTFGTTDTIKESVLDTENSLLANISNTVQISNSLVGEIDLCTNSLNSNNKDENTISEHNLGYSTNNMAQQVCSENKTTYFSTSSFTENESANKESAAENNIINHENDTDVENVDAYVSLLDDMLKHEEKDMISTEQDNIVDAKVCLDDMLISDHLLTNISKRSLSPPKEFLNSKLRRNSKCSSEYVLPKETSILENKFIPSCSNKDISFSSILRNEEDIGYVTKELASRNINTPNITRLTDNIETKASSPLETPPKSWSPEIIDSGYPNTASAQDITPEYDLSSIAQDQISDSESSSIAEVPRFGILEPVEVENGDLANNNRDDEGNNMMAVDADDNEDLQPFINVLENDLENENDIYVMQNGFPIWLLRILNMALDFDMQDQQGLRLVNGIADD